LELDGPLPLRSALFASIENSPCSPPAATFPAGGLVLAESPRRSVSRWPESIQRLVPPVASGATRTQVAAFTSPASSSFKSLFLACFLRFERERDSALPDLARACFAPYWFLLPAGYLFFWGPRTGAPCGARGMF
jgi:hypothetical protein